MNHIVIGVGMVGLALGVGVRYAGPGPDAAAMSQAASDGEYRVVRKIARAAVASGTAHDTGMQTHGSEGPVQVRLEPSAIIQDAQKQEGLQLELSIDNEEEFGHLAQYAVEVVDSFDVHYVGPELSEKHQTGKNWARGIEIPPGLPDGVYYLRLTVAGVGQAVPVAREPGNEVDSEFSVQKMVYFAIAGDRVELLDWGQYQERLTEAAESLEEAGGVQ